MNTLWQAWLKDPTKDMPESVFADYTVQCRAIDSATSISPLTGFRLLRISGADALAFLQGQLSSDVRALDGGRAQYSSYSSAKGRVLASFLLWKQGDEYFMMLCADIAEAICKRLSMYIMRSKVKAELCPEIDLFGLNGPDAARWLTERFSALPAEPLAQVSHTDGAQCVVLPRGAYLVVLPANSSWRVQFDSEWVVIGAEAWSLFDISAGIPWIGARTQEQFVAQMANMDLIGAVSFTKGCYPGQEIIARTHYLGKIKRRMYRVGLPCAAESGASLYSAEMGEQAIGMLVTVARDVNGKYLALAVAQSSGWIDGIYLDQAHVLALEKLSLPYPLSDE